MRSMAVHALAAAAVASLLLLTPRTVGAQEDISLNAVESYLAQGRIEEARTVLQTWLSTQGPDASRSERQRSIWLRAKLTVDPSMAERDLRRLVLEYPGGPFSDDALQRLALFAEARGDLREASSRFRELVRNYPISPFREEAARWLADHAAEVAALPPPPAPGTETPQDPILEDEPQLDPEPETGSIAVQAGAFQSLEHARALAGRLSEAGFEPRLVTVPGSELVRVRVGRFPTREAADVLAARMQSRGFEVTIATDAESEEVIG